VAYNKEQFNQFAEEKITGPVPSFPWAPTIGIGLPVGAFSAGFMKTKSGRRVWDYYFTSLRHLEGTIPMGMFQTFHLSEAISPFAAPERIDLLASQHPDLFKSRGFRDYLSHTTGLRVDELEKAGAFNKGLFWKKTGSSLGELRVRGGKVLATDVAAVSTGARRSGFLVEWLGHVMGVKNPAFLKDVKETADEMRPDWLFAAGGKAKTPKAKLAGRLGYAMVSSAVGRMNLLLKSPFDLEIVEDWVNKAPILKGLNLGVKPGPAHKMLWRYTKKGALAFAAYKSLDYADYLGREYGHTATIPGGILGGATAGAALGFRRGAVGKYATIGAIAGGVLGLSGEGPLSTLAGIYARARITQAEVAEVTGLGQGARRTEDFFPGLAKPSTLVATAAAGLLLGGTYDWGKRLQLVRAVGKTKGGPKAGGAVARGVYEQVDKAVEARRQSLYDHHQARAAKQTGLSKIISQFKSRYYGRMKGGKFVEARAGRTSMVALAAYEGLNIAGSLVAGDITGAAFQTAATAAAGYAFAKKGGALGMGILLASHLTREREDPEKLKRIYSGEEKVAIKSGRWWEAGRTPYQGKRPYFRPHRVALIRSGANKAALYGSEEAYWESDPFLNPVGFLLDPYAREELMWEQGYKFPVSRTPFEDTPVLGPVLAATIGRIIKPPKLMGQDQWMPEKLQEGPAGMIESPGSEPIMRTGLKGTIGEQLYRLTELVGLPGFVAQSIKEAVTGTPTFFEEDQYATPSLVGGAEPTWWGLELGGLGMVSEGIRRYIPRKRSEIDYKNPLPSDLPSWLPGRDSGYFLDFSRGDIYTKIKEPWYRLPGKGYSKLNPELEGIDPEYYSEFHRFRVLADVAPWSKEFGTYNRIISKKIAENRLTAEQMLEVQTIRKQVKEVKKAKEFQQYRYDEDAIERKRVHVTEEIEPGVYLTDTFGSAPIVMTGVDTSQLALANIARLQDASLTARQSVRAGEAKRVQASDFLREYIYPGAEIDVFIHKDPSNLMERGPGGRPQVAAVVSVGGINLNRELVERGLAESMAEGEALDPMMATSGAQRMFGNFWENLTHSAETPLESFTPLAPVAKFIHQRTALEEYQRADVYGREVSLWQKPISHFIAPGLTTTAWWAGWRGIPREVQERYMVEEYFDQLEYKKWMRLQRQAKAEGDGQLAAKYQRMAGRTKSGVDPFSEYGVRRALSSKERAYFKEFLESPTATERRDISQVVSPQMRQILHSQWAKRAAEGARMRQEAGIEQGGDLATINRFEAMRGSHAQEQRSAQIEASSEMPVPGPNWLGWDKNARIEDYKVKTILDRDMDAASYGIWRSDIRRVSRRPWVQAIEISDTEREMMSSGGARRGFNSSLGSAGHQSPHFYPRASGNRIIEVNSPGYDRLSRYMNDPSILQF
jgi:hypothetical protein